VPVNGTPTAILDVMNPPGMFKDGKRLQEWSTKNLLPISGKLIPEFDRRKSIRDMFSRNPPLPKTETSNPAAFEATVATDVDTPTSSIYSEVEETTSTNTSQNTTNNILPPPETPVYEKPVAAAKRPQKSETAAPPPKRAKSGSTVADKNASKKGQQSLKGFFKPKTPPFNGLDGAKDSPASKIDISQETPLASGAKDEFATGFLSETAARNPIPLRASGKVEEDEAFIDPVASKESWSKLFNKPSAPRCESHDEPCTTYVTKKPGINCGRSFWLCSRPLGPSGNKEKGTQWRCPTFIWASDWNGSGSSTSG
jgi:AP endonuclease 2